MFLRLLMCAAVLYSAKAYSQTTTVDYTYSDADFVNPERGFYRYSETRSGSYNPLDSATIAGYRELHTPFSAGYSVYSSLVFRYFFLEDFKTSAITQSYLDMMEADFATARAAGIKLIPRFAYTDEVDGSTCGSWICPPYGDAAKAVVLGHIEQLRPVLEANVDVIAAVQMGLIGVWGENYYTDYFGDASQPPYNLLPAEWTDRVEVLDSLLSAVPVSRQVQVRYPQMKQKAVYGIAAPVTSAPLTATEAHNGTNKARIGFHNDCFLANYDDYGTYANYDIGSSDTTVLKPYKAQDSKYTIVGGETCNLYAGSYCSAEPGMADTDLERLHFTYLNADYNNAVNDEWAGVCLDDIKRRMGYRLYLLEGTYANAVAAGGAFTYDIEIENIGYAAPANPRDAKLLLISSTDQSEWSVTLTDQPQTWHQGVHSIAGEVCLPDCMPTGSYSLYLILSDPMPSISDRPEYSIRLANTGLWQPTTGYHSLEHELTVEAGAATCGSGQVFTRDEGVNTYIGTMDGDWFSSVGNWSLGRYPDYCDHVVIPAGRKVTIQDGEQGEARSISVDTDGELELLGTGALQLED